MRETQHKLTPGKKKVGGVSEMDRLSRGPGAFTFRYGWVPGAQMTTTTFKPSFPLSFHLNQWTGLYMGACLPTAVHTAAHFHTPSHPRGQDTALPALPLGSRWPCGSHGAALSPQAQLPGLDFTQIQPQGGDSRVTGFAQLRSGL